MSDTPDGELRASLLGPVRAWYPATREVRLGPARQRTVFAVLAGHPNGLVTRDELVAAVWGGSAPATAAGGLYTYISGLRRAIGPGTDVLASGPDGYSLRIDDDELDVSRFERRFRSAAAAFARYEYAETAAILDDALALWHGEAYDGLSGPYVTAERQRLADMRLAAVEQRARARLELGVDDELIAELTALVHDQPRRPARHEMLATALHRAGRAAEAEAVQRDARATPVTPGFDAVAPFGELSRRLIAGTPVIDRPVVSRRTQGLVGRTAEMELLDGVVRALAEGRGGAVWIEGESGIGKSELLAVALAGAEQLGCRVAGGVADELGQRVQLQVLTKALGMDAPDPTQSIAANLVLAHVHTACADAPLIVAVDDMQWADPTTLLAWERLAVATRRIPLLLVSAARPEPNGRELARLRRSLEARNGHVLALEPLTTSDVEQLIGRIVGAEPGESLRALVPRAAGNPLFAREIAAGLIRQDAIHIVDGLAEIDRTVAADVPQSLIAAVHATLGHLSAGTQDVLQMAALLGNEFAVGDVAAVTGRSAYELMSAFDEATSAQVVVDAGADLAFRHPFLRQALVRGIAGTRRARMHRHAAQALALAGSSVARVAEQLAADIPIVDSWVVGWLARNHAEVVRRAPQIAGDLLQRAVSSDLPTPRQREVLLIALVKMFFRLDRYPVEEAREAMEIATDPDDREEMRQTLSVLLYRQGDTDSAIKLLNAAVDDPATPAEWRTRHRMMRGNYRRGNLDDLDRAERTARDMYDEALAAGQSYEAAVAQQTLWLTNSIRRDHEQALRHVDRALRIIRSDPELSYLLFDHLDNRVFSLQNLDRLDESQETIREAAKVAASQQAPASLQAASAVQNFWLGHWDEALAEVREVTRDAPGHSIHGMRERGAIGMLLQGIAALIAGRRDDTATAADHIDNADAVVPATNSERESCDFLIVAQSLIAEQQGDLDKALNLLGPLMIPAYAPMMLRHQWLPDAARLALEADRRDLAELAGRITAQEAARERTRARAYTAAARCSALLTGEPGPALEAAAHYRAVGRVPELAAALEDAGVLLGGARRTEEGRAALDEAVEIYRSMSAWWDVHRAERRAAEAGIR